MTSYHGADTAKIQNDMRRQAKRKQSRGTGINRDQREQVDYKEAQRNTPRHFEGLLDVALVNDIMFWAQQENKIITNGLFRRWFLNGMRLDDNDQKEKDLIVTLDGENAAIMNGVGTKIKITNHGFFLADGSPSPVVIWSITFRFSKTDMVGFQAKWDNVRNQMFIN